MNYYKHEIKRECNTSTDTVRMHVSEVVLGKNCSMIFDETKSQLQTFLDLSSFVTKLIEVLKVFKSFKSL
jgi:hypothetical protein